MPKTYPLRFSGDLETRIRELSAERGQSINQTINSLLEAGLAAQAPVELVRERLNNPTWVESTGRQIRESYSDILDLLAQ